MMDDFKLKKVAVLGAGVEGIASLRFLQKQGIKATLLDENTAMPQSVIDEITAIGGGYVVGQNAFANLSDFEVLFRSPGIPLHHSQLQKAKKNGIVIISNTKLFFDLCPCPIVGVTGTKGKGTTSSLIFEMLKASGKEVYLGGNIGN